MAIITGTGVTLKEGAVAFPNIIDISWSGWSRPEVDITTNDSTTARDIIAGTLYDPGTLTISVKLDETTAANLPPITGAEKEWKIESNGEDFTCQGFVSSVDFNWAHETENTMSFTIKLTKAVTGSYLTD